MRQIRNAIFVVGTLLVALGAAASLQDPERGDPLGLRLLPAAFFRLDRPLIAGGDFPSSLSGEGIVAVYVLPGVLLLGLGLVLHRVGRRDPAEPSSLGAGERRVDVSRATEIDLDGILELQAANQPERGGTLSASLPRSRIAAIMHDMPLIVARCGGRITGFLLTSTREMNADVPIIRASLRAHAKMGMHEVAGFVFDGNDYVVLSYGGGERGA